MALVIPQQLAEAVGLDFDKDIRAYRDALMKHSKTEGVAAPTAHPLIEVIVREHDGKYEIDKSPPSDVKASVDCFMILMDVFVQLLTEEKVIEKASAERMMRVLRGTALEMTEVDVDVETKPQPRRMPKRKKPDTERR